MLPSKLGLHRGFWKALLKALATVLVKETGEGAKVDNKCEAQICLCFSSCLSQEGDKRGL